MKIFDADAHWIETETELMKRLGYDRTRVMPRDGWDRTLNGKFKEFIPTIEDRIQFMKTNNIASAVIHPTRCLSLGMIAEEKMADTIADSFNEYTLEQIAKFPKGLLHPIALAVPQNISHTIKKLDDYKKDGFIGVLLLPHGHDELLGDSKFDAFYEKCSELELTVTVHPNSFGALGIKGFKKFSEVHCISFPFELIRQFVSICLSGVLERFPKLKIAFLEASAGWVPYWINRLDEEYELRHEELTLQKRPSETLKEAGFYVSCNGFEPELQIVNDLIGGGVIWQSDYPHWDHVNINSVFDIKNQLSSELTNKILWDNSVSCYNLQNLTKGEFYDSTSSRLL
ncbi:amidohydrolase family protein [Paenibacillus chitinolyticus]|uniref:amidohydrolase family protein n=1 Tax=Paenibacillus chitinolyticus TaxID=79263 RepID=UPI0036DA1B1D